MEPGLGPAGGLGPAPAGAGQPAGSGEGFNGLAAQQGAPQHCGYSPVIVSKVQGWLPVLSRRQQSGGRGGGGLGQRWHHITSGLTCWTELNDLRGSHDTHQGGLIVQVSTYALLSGGLLSADNLSVHNGWLPSCWTAHTQDQG